MTRPAQPRSAYDEDFFTWTQDQAIALRRLGERGDLDVEHLAEEIEDLGKRDLREVISYLELLIGHLLKLKANPDEPGVPHWRAELRAFHRSAARSFSPGMRRSIDMPTLWQRTFEALDQDSREMPLQRPVPGTCPLTLDDVLSPVFDVDVALTKMAAR